MSCKVIGIIGESKVGKTTTLKELFDKLNELNATIVDNKQQVGEDERDFSCVFSFHGKEIAIFTMGDVVKDLKKAFRTYSNRDFLICAIREEIKGSIVKDLSEDSEKLYLVRDEKDKEDDVVRKEKREEIVEQIVSLISK